MEWRPDRVLITIRQILRGCLEEAVKHFTKIAVAPGSGLVVVSVLHYIFPCWNKSMMWWNIKMMVFICNPKQFKL